MNDLTQARLREVLDYEPEMGTFRWRVALSRNVPPGAIAGYVHKDGYRRIGIGGQDYTAHRLAWLYVHGAWPDEVDHKNRQTDDNRIANLRIANRRQNNANTNRRSDNTSGFKGVYFYRPLGRWRAQISINRKRFDLGLFATPEEAHAAYVAAAKKSFGEFAHGGERNPSRAG